MINVNSIDYHHPKAPTVVICIDGCAPQYLTQTGRNKYIPTIIKFKKNGFSGIADCIIPSYTNPNNVAIITGTPPQINGIVGNWIYDTKNMVERSLSSSDDLKCKTILQVFSEAGVRVASITAKDKLRLLLGKNLQGINISAELAHNLKSKNDSIKDILKKAIKASNYELERKTDQWMYSEDPSCFALELAVELIKDRNFSPEITYVSLTDYIPHRYPPESQFAKNYFKRIDSFIRELDDLGCVIAITADHGMNNKYNPDGSPKILWLDTILLNAGISQFKTVLPITDKYAKHHGSLGGSAWIHLEEVDKAITIFSKLKGIEKVMKKKDATKIFDLPQDLIGDIFLLGDKNTVFGASVDKHTSIPSFLRSHGSLHEKRVPFIINRKLNEIYLKKAKKGLRNYQIFDFALNGI